MASVSPPSHTGTPENCSTAAHGRRNSSVELFRIIATLFVVIVHFNGWFVGGVPARFDIHDNSEFRIGQIIIQALTTCCVNCFLIISGWYGIKIKSKTIWNINWLLLCVYVPFYIVQCFYTKEFSICSLATRFSGILLESYFIQCYLMLMFLSPILNSFIEKYGRKILPYVLCFWGIEFVAEIIGNESLGIDGGYSLIHFILVYLLARTASFYKEELLNIKRIYWVTGYFICGLIICGQYIWGIRWTWNYSNPAVLLSAFCLFFPFLYKNYYNKYINAISSSTFAVFVMHTYSPLVDLLRSVDRYLLDNTAYLLYLLSVCGIVSVVFCGCIVYDKIRICVTGKISDKIYSGIHSVIGNKWLNDICRDVGIACREKKN